MVLWLVVRFSHEPLTSLLRINYSLVLVHQSCAWPNILISRCGRVLPRNRKAPYVFIFHTAAVTSLIRCLGIKVRCNNSSRESPLNIWNPSSTGESLNKSSFIWTSCIGPNAKKSMLQDQQCFAHEAYILPKQSVHSTSNFKKKKTRREEADRLPAFHLEGSRARTRVSWLGANSTSQQSARASTTSGWKGISSELIKWTYQVCSQLCCNETT